MGWKSLSGFGDLLLGEQVLLLASDRDRLAAIRDAAASQTVGFARAE
jgi:hypothetical protein